MKRYIPVLIFIVFIFSCMSIHLFAQDEKTIVWRIINKTTGKPFNQNETLIDIYGYYTVGVAEDALAKMTTDVNAFVIGDISISPPDQDGYFVATLPPTGAIIIRPGIAEPVMVPINNRTEHTVLIEANEVLEQLDVVVKQTNIVPIAEDPEIVGNVLYGQATIPVPENIGGPKARLIMQPVFVEATTNDTLKFLRPWIYDGAEYRMTQERRMSYDLKHDPLSEYIGEEELTSQNFSFMWHDSIYMENPNGLYLVKGKVVVEDYNMVYYIKEDIALASSRARRPMRFLDYSMDYRKLNPADYYVKPRPQNMETGGSMSLTFLVNKAQLDDKNPENAKSLQKLKNELNALINNPNVTLKQFHILGISSPEGPYKKNEALANERVKYAKNQVLSAIPKSKQKKIYTPSNSEVAPWSAVADLLEERGMNDEAEDVRRICRKYKSHDEQGDQMKKLSYYRSIIVPLLPQLRTVKYTYKYDELREMTPQEVLDLYETDEDFRTGKKKFMLYQYWHLFNELKDSVELHKLYRRVYDETMDDYGKPWALAANNLAYNLLMQDKPDTTILAPIINTALKCDRVITNPDGSKEIINPSAVVANQLCMYLKMNNFARASVMAQMLPDGEEFELFKAITMCLGGYYKGGGDTEEERVKRRGWVETVKNSSLRNKIVLLLAQNTLAYNKEAAKALEEMPEDDPLTWYLRAIVCGREMRYNPNYDFMVEIDFEEHLIKCFDMDPSFIGIARTDGDMYEPHLERFFKNFPEYDR